MLLNLFNVLFIHELLHGLCIRGFADSKMIPNFQGTTDSLITTTSVEAIIARNVIENDVIENDSENIQIILSSSIKYPSSKLTLQELSALLDSILIGYDQRLRPREEQTKLVSVLSDFVPLGLIEFDTQKQRFAIMGYFKMEWNDDFLTWNKSHYNGTANLRVPVRVIWTPKLVIAKAYYGDGIVGDRQTDVALVHRTGGVKWFPEGIYNVVCEVGIKLYPFDVQTCTLSYFIANEDSSTIELQHNGSVDLTEYIENGEWKLLNLTAQRTLVDGVYCVHYTFKVKRRGGFIAFTMMVPILLMSFLNGAVFLVPVESGEKCGFSVTIFVAYGIFETVIIDNLPHNSLEVSYFIIYITSLLQLVVTIVLTFYTILQSKVFAAIGDREFRVLRCLTPREGVVTWTTFLRKVDTVVFILFAVVLLVFTSVFTALMTESFELL